MVKNHIQDSDKDFRVKHISRNKGNQFKNKNRVSAPIDINKIKTLHKGNMSKLFKDASNRKITILSKKKTQPKPSLHKRLRTSIFSPSQKAAIKRLGTEKSPKVSKAIKPLKTEPHISASTSSKHSEMLPNVKALLNPSLFPSSKKLSRPPVFLQNLKLNRTKLLEKNQHISFSSQKSYPKQLKLLGETRTTASTPTLGFHKKYALIKGFKGGSKALNQYKYERNAALPPHPLLSSNERKSNPGSLINALLKRSIDFGKSFGIKTQFPHISQ
ncbi:unnamed protein product [Moneuplotes crassus]|uniref:Uncharacterized protein n=1 Tax=Euplotes crassus TaxID=5936 RepID=A0AAD1X6J1_EUPCR|nr:unnamed protein product [Moneuplotes crassus]